MDDAIRALTPIAEDAPAASDGTLRVPVTHRPGLIAEAVRSLDDAGVWIDDIAVRRPTLDDVFLVLTGHAAEERAEEEQQEEAA
jgi:ABC-2 type transport system ATP-binding protein